MSISQFVKECVKITQFRIYFVLAVISTVITNLMKLKKDHLLKSWIQKKDKLQRSWVQSTEYNVVVSLFWTEQKSRKFPALSYTIEF